MISYPGIEYYSLYCLVSLGGKKKTPHTPEDSALLWCSQLMFSVRDFIFSVMEITDVWLAVSAKWNFSHMESFLSNLPPNLRVLLISKSFLIVALHYSGTSISGITNY